MDLKEQSKVFADMATGVLDDCYKQEATRSFEVLSEESPDWNYKTAVDLAANARTRTFLAHPCCQKWLTNTFLGEIRIRELTWGFLTLPVFIKILLSAFFVFPMYIWVRFKPKITAKEKGNPYFLNIANVLNCVVFLEPQPEQDQDDEMDHAGDDANLLGNQDQMLGPQHLAAGDHKSNIPHRNSPSAQRPNDYYATLLRDREVFIRAQPPLYKMIYYMWTAPITKFWTFHMFYILYLVLFSLAVLWPSCGDKTLDIAVCSWTALIVVEYIRRTWILYKKYTSVPLVFKCIEILLIMGFVVVYATTSIWGIDLYEPYTRKVMLCFALLYFYYRLIAIYLPISPTLGPLLYRLKLMVRIYGKF